ncbi:MAG: hypothetical protein Q9218_004232 [Villophora microphyllina]
MDLPAELRIIIYDFALMVPGQINPYPTIAERDEQAMALKCERPTVALVQVNKQIREEALPSLYSNNVWVISYQTKPLLPTTVYEKHAHLFRHVALSFDHRDVTKKERKAIDQRIAEVIKRQNFLYGRLYTAADRDDLYAWAYQGALLTTIVEKIILLSNMVDAGDGAMRSVVVDGRYLKNPYNGERRTMIEAMSEIIGAHFWGGGLRGGTVESPKSKRALHRVLYDPVAAEKNLHGIMILLGFAAGDMDILTAAQESLDGMVPQLGFMGITQP